MNKISTIRMYSNEKEKKKTQAKAQAHDRCRFYLAFFLVI